MVSIISEYNLSKINIISKYHCYERERERIGEVEESEKESIINKYNICIISNYNK